MNPWPASLDALQRVRRAISRAFRHPLSAIVAAALVAAVVASCRAGVEVTSLPSGQDIRKVATMAQATVLLDVHGQRAFTLYREQRIEVPLKRISPHLLRAIVAVEDQRFYGHHGIDLVRVAGAALNNVRQGSRAEGGSTLTQQLARNSFLTPEKTYTRKFKELILARRIEGEYSKDKILELYVNKVYFGAGLYGAEAAALGYFGKSAADLSLAEAALLAGLVKSPSAYAPTVSLERATSRRNLVLSLMRDQGAVTKAQYAAAVREPVALEDSLRRAGGHGQYFKEAVRRELVDRFGAERVYEGGLRVHTTIDLGMQKAAEAEVARSLGDIEKRQAARRGKDTASPADAPQLQAALVALDPQTGEVRALVGGRDFNASPFDRARQAQRQAGSAFKPFVYAAAIEAGYSPASLITDLDKPIATPQGGWSPEDEHLAASEMTMRTALRTSSNLAAVHMLEDVGIPSAVSLAKSMGVGDVPSVPSLALGAGDVSLMSMTAAYGAFANHGLLPEPRLIRRVETQSGEVLFESTPSPQRVISESTAFLMTTMLADVVNSGTAWSARRVGFTLPAAGKTGTTNDYRDAWFIGFTPSLVSGVWIGYDQPKTIIAGGYATELAVPLWGRFMMQATKGDAPDWYAAPDTVVTATICPLSGKLATNECGADAAARPLVDYFASDHVPTEYCDHHALTGRRGFFGGLVATVRGRSSEGSTPAPSPATATPAEPEAEKKQRGFWGRVFGRRN